MQAAASPHLGEFPVNRETVIAYQNLHGYLRWKVQTGYEEVQIAPDQITGLDPLLQRQDNLHKRVELLSELYDIEVTRDPLMLRFTKKSEKLFRRGLEDWLRDHDKLGLLVFQLCRYKFWRLERHEGGKETSIPTSPQHKLKPRRGGKDPKPPCPPKGLSLLGICRGHSKDLEERRVWCNREFGPFDLSKELMQAKCPREGCRRTLQKVNAFALRACRFKFKGLEKSHHRNLPFEQTGIVSEDEVLICDDEGSQAEWRFLEVTVKPLE